MNVGMFAFLSLAHAQDSRDKYTVGPEDVIEINVSKHSEFSGIYHVDLDGKIQYTYVGDMDVEGLNKDQLEEKIKKIISKYCVSPEVNVIITEFKSKAVYVLGEVAKPGKYNIRSENITVKEAIMLAGLPTQLAALHSALIITAGVDNKSAKEIDLFALLYHGDTTQNMVLSPGDTLYVPGALKEFYVIGEVLRPGKYNMSYESIPVKEALIRSGLPTKVAALNKARIMRKDKSTQEVNLYSLLYSADSKKEIFLYSGDTLYVPAVVAELQENIKDNGVDFDPLKYTLGPDDVIDINVVNHPELSGLYPVSLEGKVQFKFVGDIYATGLTKGQLEEKIKKIISADVAAPEVSVTITEFKSKAFYVVGEVRNPGKYFMRSDSITVSEAIMLSGLPTESAAMRKTRIITPGIDGSTIRKVNLYALLYKGNLKEDLLLKPGDYLYVPSTVLAKVLRIILPVTNTVGAAGGAASVAVVTH